MSDSNYDTGTLVVCSILIIVAGILTYGGQLGSEGFTALAGAILGYIFRRARGDYAVPYRFIDTSGFGNDSRRN